jgi:hypothetical protein
MTFISQEPEYFEKAASRTIPREKPPLPSIGAR